MKQEFSLKVEGKEWVRLQDTAFEKVNKDAKIDGFRPGKAPRNMYEKKYGKQENAWFKCSVNHVGKKMAI